MISGRGLATRSAATRMPLFLRHRDVEHDEVGRKCRDALLGFAAGRCGADHRDIVDVAEQSFEPAQRQRFVVDEQDEARSCRRSSTWVLNGSKHRDEAARPFSVRRLPAAP